MYVLKILSLRRKNDDGVRTPSQQQEEEPQHNFDGPTGDGSNPNNSGGIKNSNNINDPNDEDPIDGSSS